MSLSTYFLVTVTCILSLIYTTETSGTPESNIIQKQNLLDAESSTTFSAISSLLPLDLNSKEEDQPSDHDDLFQDYVHDIDVLESMLGGPLHNRKFVTVTKTRAAGGGKEHETSYKFRTNARVKRDSIKELKGEDEESHPKTVGKEDLEELQKTPPGFDSNTIYYHFTHQLSALERSFETPATFGSQCETKSNLDYDYCERAAYPNKNKMVCSPINTTHEVARTCQCKYYRTKESARTGHDWKQMKRGRIVLQDGQNVSICLVPAFGVCDHRVPTGIKDIYGNDIFEVDVCKGHYQCDNTKHYRHLIETAFVLTIKNHCTESEFLRLFKKEVRHEVLVCAKPHPRRFSDYDGYRYYCLPKKSRDPDQWVFKKPPSEESDKEHDIFFEDRH